MTVIEHRPSTDLVPTTGQEAVQLALDLGVEMNLVSATFTNVDLTYPQWESLGRSFGFVGDAWKWWVGDWLKYGETIYGEQAAQATDDITDRYDATRRITGLDESQLLHFLSVASKIPSDQRVPGLRYSHHEKVASLDPDDRAEWLAKARENHWNAKELGQAIRESRLPEPLVDPAPDPVPLEPEISRGELRDIALNLVYQQAQPLSDGDYRLPSEVYAQVAAALGEQS